MSTIDPLPAAPFLTASWRHLLMLNFAIEPDRLLSYVPQGTELDFFEGETFVSIVGFQFLKTRVLGMWLPYHYDFDEVNLRFYVRRREGGRWRRGVTFIREIAPRWLISFIARAVYNENYLTLPIRCHVEEPTAATNGSVRYEWKYQGRRNHIEAKIAGEVQAHDPASLAHFITEHYWGYAKQRSGLTAEYQVDHPSWKTWHVERWGMDIDAHALYGPLFADVLNAAPRSVFVADGSDIVVRRRRIVPA